MYMYMYNIIYFSGIYCPYAPGKMDPNLQLPTPQQGTYLTNVLSCKIHLANELSELCYYIRMT